MKAHILFAPLALAAAFFIGHASASPTQPQEPASLAWPLPVAEAGDVVYWRTRAQHFHQLAYARRRQNQELRHALHYSGGVSEAINLACTIYGNCATLWRKAGCETGGTFSATSVSKSSSARGVFQFLTRGGKTGHGTWGTTPFARFSVYSPYANALAAGWMHANGRGGEWDCR